MTEKPATKKDLEVGLAAAKNDLVAVQNELKNEIIVVKTDLKNQMTSMWEDLQKQILQMATWVEKVETQGHYLGILMEDMDGKLDLIVENRGTIVDRVQDHEKRLAKLEVDVPVLKMVLSRR